MPSKLAAFDLHDLYRRYQSGETLDQIGRSIGIPFATVARWFKDAGLPARSTSEAQHLTAARRSPEQRKAFTIAANAAVRGVHPTEDHRSRIALSKERVNAHQSEIERQFLQLLPPDAQTCTAIGPYNVDITLGPVAVEVFGGGWHGGGRAAARWPKRAKFLLDAGWTIVVVWVEDRRYPLTVHAAEYVIAMAERLRRNPSATAEYRVIRGTGEEIIRRCAQDDDFPVKVPRGRGERSWCDHAHVAG